METERKILKVENAEQSLAFLLMAKNVKFAYSYGAFYIFDTHNPELFLSDCKGTNNPRQDLIRERKICRFD